jgi:CrcB protein
MIRSLLNNKFTLVMAGGAVGSLLRYLVQGWGQALTKGSFPIGTLDVNVIGCFLIGMLNMVFAGPIPIRMENRVGLTVGLLGGFTTFSSFGWESFAMANAGQGLRAMMNLLLSITLGFVAVWVAYRLAERWSECNA